MNIIAADGNKAKIGYNPGLGEFRGEILGLNGSADFFAENPAAPRREFRACPTVFPGVCKEEGKDPTKMYSGRFNLRVRQHCAARLPTGQQLNSIIRC